MAEHSSSISSYYDRAGGLKRQIGMFRPPLLLGCSGPLSSFYQTTPYIIEDPLMLPARTVMIGLGSRYQGSQSKSLHRDRKQIIAVSGGSIRDPLRYASLLIDDCDPDACCVRNSL